MIARALVKVLVFAFESIGHGEQTRMLVVERMAASIAFPARAPSTTEPRTVPSVVLTTVVDCACITAEAPAASYAAMATRYSLIPPLSASTARCGCGLPGIQRSMLIDP
jgi:hypothetical protein